MTLITRDQSLRLCRVVFAERSGETESSDFKRAHAELIELGPLDPEDQVALLGEAVGDQAAGAVIDAWLAGNNTGLPFDLKETARALLDRDAIPSETEPGLSTARLRPASTVTTLPTPS